jgi:glycosyltransferase involved in cell wall biosynthesis
LEKSPQDRLLYINYWGIDDALTISTVYPNLKIIRPYCSEIYLATVERNGKKRASVPDDIVHVPFYSATWLPRILEKVYDVTFFCFKLFFLVKKRKIDLVICRGSMAAIFGVFLNRTTGLSFMVESFEPHSDYMAEGDTWKKNGLEYRFQKWIEEQSSNRALYVMPVTHNYANFLTEKGVPSERILVMPCCVDIEKFSYNEIARMQIRKKLNIAGTAIVGVYVGKFGDIYLKKEAFTFFKQAYDFFGDSFFLIILSPQDIKEIEANLAVENFPKEKAFVSTVSHDSVPEFLSAADFSFSLVRTSPSRKYCSPVKNGEYWANGLPILLPKGVGDDEMIIRMAKAGGAIFDIDDGTIMPSLSVVKELISYGRLDLARKISPIALQHRNFEIIANGYKEVFTKWRFKG